MTNPVVPDEVVELAARAIAEFRGDSVFTNRALAGDGGHAGRQVYRQAARAAVRAAWPVAVQAGRRQQARDLAGDLVEWARAQRAQAAQAGSARGCRDLELYASALEAAAQRVAGRV